MRLLHVVFVLVSQLECAEAASEWCNAYTCGLAACRNSVPCNELAAKTYCASWCSKYTDDFEHCAGCAKFRFTSAEFFDTADCSTAAYDPFSLGMTNFASIVTEKVLGGSCGRNALNTADATFTCTSPGTVQVQEYTSGSQCAAGQEGAAPVIANGLCSPLGANDGSGNPIYIKMSYEGACS